MTEALAAVDVRRVLMKVAPSTDIATSTVTPAEYSVTTPSTEALDRVVATTTDGVSFSVFVKTLHSLRHWPMIEMIPEAMREAAFAQFPWRVEADVYASGLLGDLPDGLRGPRIYAIDDLGDDRLRIWMEDVPEAPVTWDTARYALAAHHLGRHAGQFLRSGLPAGAPRLAPDVSLIFRRRTAVFDIPVLRTEEAWRHPLIVPIERSDPALRGDLLGLADEAPGIIDALDRLPHAFAHGDACPQNLLPDPLEDRGFVAIDWGFANLAPLGYDLGQLLVGHVENGDIEASEIPSTVAAILPAYVDGLIAESATVTVDEVRQGFIGGLILRSAFTAIPFDRLRGPTNDGDAAFLMKRARYARQLVDLRRSVEFAV